MIASSRAASICCLKLGFFALDAPVPAFVGEALAAGLELSFVTMRRLYGFVKKKLGKPLNTLNVQKATAQFIPR
jgi:hypothetical protein